MELKPCPFCGGEAEARGYPLKRTLEEAVTSEPQVRCTTTGCLARFVICSLSEWNHRAGTEAVGLVRELQDALKQSNCEECGAIFGKIGCMECGIWYDIAKATKFLEENE